MARHAHALALLLVILPVGCSPVAPEAAGPPPLPVQQARAYEETVTGRFVSLADFEDAPLMGEPGYAQVKQFAIEPAGAGGELNYVVNITRTGVGAMEVLLPPGAALVYRPREVHNFSEYTLLMLAVHSRAIRDDLKVAIATDRGEWESLPLLLKSGWNNVLIDLQRLKAAPDFQPRGVRAIRLHFAQASAPVRFNVDDIMLIDNRRELPGLPEGMALLKTGLDYELRLPQQAGPIHLRQCDDGLWRLSPHQPTMLLGGGTGTGTTGASTTAPSTPGSGAPAEDLGPMGDHRVGQVEILECNRIRLRIGNTWYFPTAPGEWASLGIRQMRWEYTFYADGRWLTDLVVNNSGGQAIGALRIDAGPEAIWADGTRGTLTLEKFPGMAGRWQFLRAGGGPRRAVYESNFVKPAAMQVRIGRIESAPDGSGDGFDRSDGCYRLRARGGNCRFLVTPGGDGLADGVFRVSSAWQAGVTASSEGLALRDLVRLPDGSALFVLPGAVRGPRWVEVAGPVPPLAEE